MENINLKQEMLDLCDISILFWNQFKQEIDTNADIDNSDLILKWYDYFEEHPEFYSQLSRTRLCVKSLEKELINRHILKIEN